jgi:hypothetical protein
MYHSHSCQTIPEESDSRIPAVVSCIIESVAHGMQLLQSCMYAVLRPFTSMIVQPKYFEIRKDANHCYRSGKFPKLCIQQMRERKNGTTIVVEKSMKLKTLLVCTSRRYLLSLSETPLWDPHGDMFDFVINC